MQIKKGEKTYIATEHRTDWLVTISLGALTIEYKIDKSMCPGESELREYIQKEDMF